MEVLQAMQMTMKVRAKMKHHEGLGMVKGRKGERKLMVENLVSRGGTWEPVHGK
jgi:hypothetical protein